MIFGFVWFSHTVIIFAFDLFFNNMSLPGRYALFTSCFVSFTREEVINEYLTFYFIIIFKKKTSIRRISLNLPLNL